ncbi:MAG: hypothetical protein CMN86_07830 [Stappia sp.]|jgi:hypothetical protein|uniref:hypothetical protein n=1 Tax=Stappia sp. TaxID=1870903 RepID=UPI000C912F62|nr:hypothetical protein [Stappia sp.]
MPFLGLLATIVVGAAIWYWRLKMIREAGSEVIDSVERMRGAYKRKQFRKKVEEAPLASIEDPVIAAVTFYFCLANEKPAHKDEATAVIRDGMREIVPAHDMEEVLVMCDWIARNVINADDPVQRFQKLWRSHLNQSELHQLVSIAGAVCEVGGGPDEEQERVLRVLHRKLLN